jgi:hypothetical protein
MADKETLLHQYDMAVELYKFYMEFAIKLNLFYYAITGGILSFYFANPTIEGIKYSLLLPVVMSVAFAIFFIYGAILMTPLRREVFAVRDALELRVSPDLGVLSVLLYIFALVFTVTAIGCGYLIWFNC